MGIVFTIGVPIYSHYQVKAKRIEAILALNKLALALEQYAMVHDTYRGVSLEQLGMKEWIANNNYQIAITLATRDQFKLEARPYHTQAHRDTACATLTLNALGEKGITGKRSVEECW